MILTTYDTWSNCNVYRLHPTLSLSDSSKWYLTCYLTLQYTISMPFMNTLPPEMLLQLSGFFVWSGLDIMCTLNFRTILHFTFGDNISPLFLLDTTYFTINIVSVWTWASFGAVIYLASLPTTLKMPGHDWPLHYVHTGQSCRQVHFCDWFLYSSFAMVLYKAPQ